MVRTDWPDSTTLCSAARQGKLQDVRDLLDRGVPVDAEFASTRETPLVYAASWVNVDVVRLLLPTTARETRSICLYTTHAKTATWK